MLESLQTGVFEYEKLKPEEMQRRGILGRLVGIMADSVNPTRNGRAYSKKLWENVFANPIMQERIENKCCFGELGHPTDREETDMSKIAICMDGLPKVDPDGKLRAVFNILDTPNGRILKTLCDYGCNIGISSRGSGDLITDFDGNESVDPDTYNCEGWDAVLIPAVKEARLQYVTESLDKKRYNKTLRTRLQESIDKETEENKKAMTEALNTFGIRLMEAEGDIEEEPTVGPEPNEDFLNDIEMNSEEPSEEPVDVDASAFEDLPEPEFETNEPVDIDISEPLDMGPEPNFYKGVEIIEDTNTGKFICEIDQETYVFNSEKNARIWIDMNAKEVKDDIADKKAEEIQDELKDEESEKINDQVVEDELDEEEPIKESLNEEQVGRDKIKDDKDADEVVHSEERKDEEDKDSKEEKEGKVTIKFNEAYGDSSEDAVIAEFIRDCIEKLKIYDNRTDIELEIPDTLDTDLFWMDLNEAARDAGIYLSMQEREEIDDEVYLYFYISKTDDFVRDFENQLAEVNDSVADAWDRSDKESEREWAIRERDEAEEARLTELNKSDWERLNSTEQMVVDAVLSHIENNGMTEPLEDLVRQACSMYNEANAFDEYSEEDFYEEEAKDGAVLEYIKKNYENLGKDMLKYNESFNESVDDINAARMQLRQYLDDWYKEHIAPELSSDVKASGWDSDLQDMFLEFRNYLTPDILHESRKVVGNTETLREMLKQNKKLEQKIIGLQEKLSACYAKEKKLNEDVESYKEKISKLSKNSKSVKVLEEKLNKTEDSKDKLQESLDKKIKSVKSLTEQLNKMSKDNQSMESELSELKESYAGLDKDYTQMKEQFDSKFERQNKLLEKYQKITKNSVDRYINLQATNLGVKPSEIKNKLPEKFSFNDVDSICEELRDYKLNVSRLPFSTGRNKLNEGVSMRVNNLSKGLIPTNEVDELNDYDMKLMEMYK